MMVTQTELDRRHARQITSYDAQGKSARSLAHDYVSTYRALDPHRAARRAGRSLPGADVLTSRLILIEEALEAAGGCIDVWRDQGDCRIYGPRRTFLARF